MKVNTVIGWVIVALVTLFIFVNWTTPQRIWLLPWVSVQMPLSVALLAAAAMGFGAAHLLRMVKKDRKS